MFRLPKTSDLLGELTALCARENVTRGMVSLIGALECAQIGYYHQDTHEYAGMTVNEHVEILSGQGNVSLKDGKPFVHLHLVLGRSDGSCLGGHAAEGCRIFACEAVILVLDGPELVREPDEPTGLALWRA